MMKKMYERIWWFILQVWGGLVFVIRWFTLEYKHVNKTNEIKSSFNRLLNILRENEDVYNYKAETHIPNEEVHEVIHDFLKGYPREGDEKRIILHLKNCPDCRKIAMEELLNFLEELLKK